MLRLDTSEVGLYEQRRLGLDEPAQIEAAGQILPNPLAMINIDGVSHWLMRHPQLYKMKHVSDWIEDYFYTEQYKVPIPFQKRNPLWLEAKRVFEYYYYGAKKWLAEQSSK